MIRDNDFIAANSMKCVGSTLLVSFCRQQFNWLLVLLCKTFKVTSVIQFSSTKRKIWLLNKWLVSDRTVTALRHIVKQVAQTDWAIFLLTDHACYILTCWQPSAPPSAMRTGQQILTSKTGVKLHHRGKNSGHLSPLVTMSAIYVILTAKGKQV